MSDDPKQSRTQVPTAERQAKSHTWVLPIQLFTAAAAIAGAVVGPMVSINIANSQVEANYRQSQTEFLHTQRQAAYAKFSADVEDFRNVIFKGNSYLISVAIDEKEASTVRLYGESIYDAHNAVIGDMATLKLIASMESSKAADDVSAKVTSMYFSASCAISKDEECPHGRDFDATKVESYMSEHWTGVMKARDVWNEAARHDLDMQGDDGPRQTE